MNGFSGWKSAEDHQADWDERLRVMRENVGKSEKKEGPLRKSRSKKIRAGFSA